MWWEILPSATIIGTLLAVPQFIVYFANKYDCNDHPHRRNIFMPMNLGSWFRDQRLTGNPYVVQGLNSLPDEPVKTAKK